MTDESILTIGNEIYFFGEVDEKSALKLNTLLRKMEQRSFSHIVIYIHSTGGDVYAGLSVMDHIESLKIPVHTVADGLCCSAATFILLAGTRRLMKKNARVMIHQASSSNEVSKHTDLKDEMQHLDGLMNQMKRIYMEKTKIPQNRLKSLMRRDVYLNIEQCLKYGIVHSQF